MPRTDHLKTSWYYILLTLSAEPRHGLEIAREVSQLSGGRVRLWPTALYGAIETLTEHGWIEEIVDDRRRPANASERKRIYVLTAPGRAVLRQETRRLEDLVRLARTLQASDKRGRA